MPDAIHLRRFVQLQHEGQVMVRDVAVRLRKDGLKVWFDEWVVEAGDSIPERRFRL